MELCRYTNSCPLIGQAFEINRRLVCVMRLLGIGNEGLNLFCGLMDLTQEFYSKTYHYCLENLHTASKAVYVFCTKSAMQEEEDQTLKNENSNRNLTISGDGSWKKRGFSTRYEDSDIVAIKRTQTAPGQKLHSKFLGPYSVEKALLNDRYVVQKLGDHQGPTIPV